MVDMREMKVTPHVAQNDTNRSSAIDERTTRHPGYRLSQNKRKRTGECFGWLKTVGGLRKRRFVGKEKPDFQFVLAFAAFNLIRMRNPGWCRVKAYRPGVWFPQNPDWVRKSASGGRSPRINAVIFHDSGSMTGSYMAISTAC